MRSSVQAVGDNLVDVVVTHAHIAVMDPAVPVLEQVLHYRRKSYTAGGPLGYQEVEENVALCEFDHKGRLCFAVGLLPRVLRVLQEHGCRVRVNDQRKSGPRLRVDHDALDGADDGNKPLIRAVAREPLGRIEAHADEDAMAKMLMVAGVFPEARVVVAVATKKQAWKLWRELEEHLDGPVGLAASGTRREGRWLVGTFQSIPRGLADEYDILLLPHGEESTGEKVCEMVAGMSFKRIYAFVRPQRRADRLAQLRLEQMAGQIIHRVEKPRVPVGVLMLPTPACEVTRTTTPLERKRTLYWRNRARNERIAEVAKAVVSQDRVAIKQLGLRNKDISAVSKCDKTEVVVLVETPEHGRELLTLLPGWRMLDMVGQEATKNQEVGMNDANMPAVMTTSYAAKRGTKADIVIRATGTEWALRIKGFPRQEGKHTPGELLVIDFDDEFHASAIRDAERRVGEYESRNMRVRTTKSCPP